MDSQSAKSRTREWFSFSRAKNAVLKGMAILIMIAQLSRKGIAGMALLYLLLPCILFLLGWVQETTAYFAVILLLVGAVIVWRSVPSGGRSLSQNDWAWWVAGALLCLFATESLGLNGHTLQSADIPVRSVIYDQLVYQDWPLFSVTGDYFVYYHAFWLPPAMVAKLVPGAGFPALYFWIFLGLLLAYTAFLSRWRGKRAFFSFLLVLLLGSLADAVFSYPGYLSTALKNISPALSCFFLKIQGLIPEGRESYLVNWDGVAEHTFNSAVPTVLLLSVCMVARLPLCCRLFFCALLVPVSPLCAVGVLPWLACSLCRSMAAGRRALAITLSTAFCALPLVICTALYYVLGNGSSARFLWEPSSYYRSIDQELAGRWVRYVYILLALLVPAFVFLYRRYKRTALFWCSVFLAVTTPLVWIGEDNNELVYKCSVIIFFPLALLYASLYFHTRRKGGRVMLMVFMLMGMAGSICDIGARVMAHYSWDETVMKKNVRDKKQGDMGNPKHRWYRRFHGKKTKTPILYSEPGESSKGPLRFMHAGNTPDLSKEAMIKGGS